MFDQLNKLSICGVLSLILLAPAPGYCAPASKSGSESGYRPVYNYDMRSRFAGMQSELAMLNNDIERAIARGRSAVERDPEDMDARVAYGEALFAKVQKTGGSNPALFNECVKSWLIVHRSLVGEESELSYKGISLPLASKLYEDPQRSGLARERLRELCGRAPRFWETNNKYLKSVLKPETSVSGKFLSRSQSQSQSNRSQ